MWRMMRPAARGPTSLCKTALKQGLRTFPVTPRSAHIRSMIFSSSGERMPLVVEKSRMVAGRAYYFGRALRRGSCRALAPGSMWLRRRSGQRPCQV